MIGPYDTNTLLHVFFLIAIVVEAMTAALVAGKREMDWLGVCLLGCVTALGGGSMRDVLLGNTPLSWVQHPHYLLLTAGAALLTIGVARYMHKLRKIFLFLDAVGLVVFTVIGCNVAIGLELPFVVVIASGMITGCVGGVLRDLLCNNVPLLFRAELYATVSIVTGILYVGGDALGVNHTLVMCTAMAVGLSLRLLAIRFNWSMPKFIYKGDMD
jgi:uncharacterized membrane protein YeiH